MLLPLLLAGAALAGVWLLFRDAGDEVEGFWLLAGLGVFFALLLVGLGFLARGVERGGR